MTKTDYLELRNISKLYDSGSNEHVVALKPINLSIARGDFVVVIGNNAAGKSTLLNLILGTTTPSSGTIHLEGLPLAKMNNVNKARIITCVRQNPNDSVINTMTIAENLALAKRRTSKTNGLKQINDKLRNEFIDLLTPIDPKLARNIDTQVSSLSGGQKQTIALIMAIISKPKILLLDEHTAALDPKRRIEIMELTERLIQEHRITTIMITHDILQALEHGNRLIMLNNGTLILDEKEKKHLLTYEEIKELYATKE